MLLRVTKMCCARLEAVQVSQIWDLIAATFIMPMPVEKGQAGGGVEFLTRTIPVPLAKIPATQVVPQDASARDADATAALRSEFRILRGGHRMDLLRYATMRGWNFCGRFYACEWVSTSQKQPRDRKEAEPWVPWREIGEGSDALDIALSPYNTGDADTGFQNSYEADFHAQANRCTFLFGHH
jgi:hypothetical protein